MQLLERIERIDRIILNSLKWAMILLMILVTVSVSWGVFTRYALRSAALWTGELSGFMLVWITYLGAAYAVLKKTHIRFESLFDILPKSVRIVLDTIFNLAMMFFVAVLMYYGYILAMASMNSLTISLPITKGYFLLILPISGALMVYGFLVDIIKTFKRGDTA